MIECAYFFQIQQRAFVFDKEKMSVFFFLFLIVCRHLRDVGNRKKKKKTDHECEQYPIVCEKKISTESKKTHVISITKNRRLEK